MSRAPKLVVGVAILLSAVSDFPSSIADTLAAAGAAAAVSDGGGASFFLHAAMAATTSSAAVALRKVEYRFM